VWRIWISTWTALAACQDGAGASAGDREPTVVEHAASRAIEVRDARSNVVAKVLVGRPCRATVGERELIVGGPPLVATSGTSQWTGEDAPNGTTLRLNDRPIARIHAKQLFDAEGIPLVRVLDNGDVANGPGRIVRKATIAAGMITIHPLQGDGGDLTVTGLAGGPDDLALAVMLAAPEAAADVRALAACHYLLGRS
jgi:hypothetical protein